MVEFQVNINTGSLYQTFQCLVFVTGRGMPDSFQVFMDFKEKSVIPDNQSLELSIFDAIFLNLIKSAVISF